MVATMAYTGPATSPPLPRGRLAALLVALAAVFAPAHAQPSSGDATLSTSMDVVVGALALIGSPYRYGGRTPDGFDCSGFVAYVYGATLGVVLPRRSEEMVRVGTVQTREALMPGDLVFFNTLGRRYSHVGIFIGDGRFVHAPARGGRVRVERLSDPYWNARYNGARRPDAVGATTQVVVIVEPPPAAADSTP